VVGGQSSGVGGQQSSSGKLFKGLAQVVPDFGLGSRPHDGQQAQTGQPGGGTSSFMQKLNDLTHHNPIIGATANQQQQHQQHQQHQQQQHQQQQQQQQPDHGVDNILSKGKELIFMKFGLGK
jgi:RIMS-binding protein 2